MWRANTKCYVQGRLLQSAVGGSTKVCYRQVAVGHERCNMSCKRHEEVRQRLDTPASLWATLARCGRSSHIQAWVTVYKCLHGQAPHYLSELCTPVAQVAERQRLRSASRHLLIVPRFQLSGVSYAVAPSPAGPTTWNLLKNNLREPDM